MISLLLDDARTQRRELEVAVSGERAAHALDVLRAAGGAATSAGGDPAERILVLASSGDAARRLEQIGSAAAAGSGALVATMPDDAGRGVLRRALRAGARRRSSRRASSRRTLVPDDPSGAARASSRSRVALRRQLAPRPLSYREKQILGLVCGATPTARSPIELFVAESTVKTHLSSAFAKLDARSRAEAAALILDPDEGYGLGILTSMAPHAAERRKTVRR